MDTAQVYLESGGQIYGLGRRFTVMASVSLVVKDCNGEPALFYPDAYWLEDRHNGHAGVVLCDELAPMLFPDA